MFSKFKTTYILIFIKFELIFIKTRGHVQGELGDVNMAWVHDHWPKLALGVDHSLVLIFINT